MTNLDISSSNPKNLDNDIPARTAIRHGSVSGLVDASSQDVVNSRAIEVINRIQSKLNGRDFYQQGAAGRADGLAPVVQASSVEEQVNRLIVQATSVENLCQLFVGWCPFW